MEKEGKMGKKEMVSTRQEVESNQGEIEKRKRKRTARRGNFLKGGFAASGSAWWLSACGRHDPVLPRG